MSIRNNNLVRTAWLLGGLALTLASTAHAGEPPRDGPHLGRLADPAKIAGMDLTVGGDGAGLPPGSGVVAEGLAIYLARCQACHGEAGRGGIADRLTGGVGTIASAKPVKTVASYWPYATTLFDYIRRAMPLTAPQSLSADEVYGLVAYLLSVDRIVPADARLNAARLAGIRMPNRNGFVSLESRNFDGNIETGRQHH